MDLTRLESLSRLSSNQRDKLLSLITTTQPFGPPEAEAFDDPEIAWLLFTSHNELCEEYKKDPNVIVGRKGSGKTAMMQNTNKIDSHYYTVIADSGEILSYIHEQLFPDGIAREIMVERISSLWVLIFDTLLMAEVASRHRPDVAPLPAVRGFLKSSSVPTGKSSVEVFAALKGAASSIPSGSVGGIVTGILAFIEAVRVNYQPAKNELVQFLAKNKRTSVVIVDSVEEYFINSPTWSRVYGGLLKAAGAYGDDRRQIRLFLPSEYYFDLQKASSNIAKDFKKNMLLQWLPSELYSVIIWRYRIYCELYMQEMIPIFQGRDLLVKSDVAYLIENFLGRPVKNGTGTSERLISYVFRHTQLLPRQILSALNQIFGQNSINRSAWSDITNEEILRAVKRVEKSIAAEIIGSYEKKFPALSKICSSVIVRLPRLFKNGELQSIFNESGKKYADSFGMEFDEIRTMLIEVGVIGRVNQIKNGVAYADFEYASPGRLFVDPDQDICLHPVFSGVYACESNKNNGKPIVYPSRILGDEMVERMLHVEQDFR